MSDVTTWDAAAWLDELRAASSLVARERQALERRHEALFDLGSLLSGGPSGKGGVPDVMGKVDAYVDWERARRAEPDGAWEELAEGMCLVAGLRLAGLAREADVIQRRVLDRMTWEDVAEALGVSRRTAFNRYDVAVDMLQAVGKARAVAGDWSPIAAEDG